MKKVLCAVLALCLLCGLTAPGAAAADVPEGYTPISTPEELDAIRYNLGGNYILMNDIDMKDFGNWLPIGDYNAFTNAGNPNIGFSGVLDGNGYAIFNLTSVHAASVRSLNDSNFLHAGLFLSVRGGAVKNLRMENVNVSASMLDLIGLSQVQSGKIYGSNVAAYAGGIAASAGEGASFLNCSVSGGVKAEACGSEQINAYAGGFVGSSRGEDNYGAERKWNHYKGCTNTAAVSASVKTIDCYDETMIPSQGISAYAYAGGIAGGHFYNFLTRCANNGKITVNAECQTEKKVSTSHACAGGVIGDNQYGWLINSYNTGAVEGMSTQVNDSSGLYSNKTWLGGLAGTASSAYIKGCYNTGMVKDLGSREKYVTAISANGSYINISCCYYLNNGLLAIDGDTNWQYTHTISYAEALTDAQLKQKDNFKGFDFENVWNINEGMSYPALRVDTSGTLKDPDVFYDPYEGLKWWEILPPFLQWILKWVFFGWIWMR